MWLRSLHALALSLDLCPALKRVYINLHSENLTMPSSEYLDQITLLEKVKSTGSFTHAPFYKNMSSQSQIWTSICVAHM